MHCSRGHLWGLCEYIPFFHSTTTPLSLTLTIFCVKNNPSFWTDKKWKCFFVMNTQSQMQPWYPWKWSRLIVSWLDSITNPKPLLCCMMGVEGIRWRMLQRDSFFQICLLFIVMTSVVNTLCWCYDISFLQLRSLIPQRQTNTMFYLSFFYFF